MPPFRLLDLPPRALKKTLSSLNFLLLIMCNKKIAKKIQALYLEPQLVHAMHTMCRHGFDIKLEDTWIHWRFRLKSEVEDQSEYRYEFKIEDQVFKTRYIPSLSEFNGYNSLVPFVSNFIKYGRQLVIHDVEAFIMLCDNYEDAVDTFICFMRDHFGSKIDKFTLDGASNTNFQDFFLTKVNDACDEFSFGQVVTDSSDDVELKSEDLKFVLDNLTPDIYLEVNGLPASDFTYDKPLRMPGIALKWSHWFDRRNLLDSQCQKIMLGNNHNLEIEDLNAFIKKWLNGNDTNFITLIATFGELADCLQSFMRNIEILHDGLDVKARDSTRHGPDYEDNLMNYRGHENIVDIYRSDGLAASIVSTGVTVIFGVWHLKEDKSINPYEDYEFEWDSEEDLGELLENTTLE